MIALSCVPFLAPFLMPMRALLSSVSPIEIMAALAILLVSLALALFAAARIYSAGVLLCGAACAKCCATRVPRCSAYGATGSWGGRTGRYIGPEFSAPVG